MDRYIIIIGAMKSGTTTVFEVLANHSKISPAKDKEPGFFAFDALWEKGYEWYHSLFEFDPNHHNYRLEASTDYTKSPFVKDVWKRMCAYPNKEFKLIYVMRDPIQRLESHARHAQNARKELGQEDSTRTDHSLDAGLSIISMSTSQYAYQLGQFEGAIEKNLVHFVIFEELRCNPQKVFSDIYSFLNLNEENLSDSLPEHNVAAQRMEMTNMWKRLSSFQTLTTVSKIFMPMALRKAFKEKFYRKVQVEGRFKFSRAEELALIAFFDGDISELSNKYGIQVPKEWNTAKRD